MLGVVVTHTADIVVKYLIDSAIYLVYLQEFVYLLLVFGYRVFDFGVIDHVDQFFNHCILIGRNRYAAQTLCGAHGPVQTRAIATDNEEFVAAPETMCGEPVCKGFYFLGSLCPGPGLPDAEFFFSN